MFRFCLVFVFAFTSGFVQAECLEFPVKFTRFSLPTIWVEILGEKKAFIFDSGMSRALSLEKSLFDNLVLNQEVELTKQLDIAGESSQARCLKNQALTLAGHLFKNIEVAEYKPWGLILISHESDEKPIDNTIGLGLFNSGLLSYSQSQKTLHFCEAGDTFQPTDDFNWYPLRRDAEGVHFTAFVGKKSYNLVLDTASTVSFIKPQQNVLTAPCTNHPKQSCVKLDHYGEFYVQEFPEDFEADGILGGNFFEAHDVIIDNINQRLGLKKVESS